VSAHYSRRVTAFCLAVAAGALICATGLVWAGDSPAWTVVALFAVLAGFSETCAVELPSTDTISTGYMLAIASIVALSPEHSLLGPMIVGMACGLYPRDARAREWRKAVFNMANLGLSALAAAAVFNAFPGWWLDSTSLILVAATFATLAFFLVNDVLVATVISLETGRSVHRLLREFRASELQAFPFAIFGAFVGKLYLDVGPIIVPLLVVPILIARQTFASFVQVKAAHEATVETLISALEAKDHYTAGHVERVAVYAEYMGEDMGLSLPRLQRLRFAALMHDVGKLVVPNQLLNKPGKVTDAEFRRIREHESVSVAILSRIDFLAPVATSASSRFTEYDKGDDKHPIEPYIVHVADAYDAMTSTRAYRKALTQEIAFAELRDKAGSQFHPECVETLIAAIERRDEHHGRGYETDEEQWAVPPPESGTGSAGLGDLEQSDEVERAVPPPGSGTGSAGLGDLEQSDEKKSSRS
jgi:hypothetical protein